MTVEQLTFDQFAARYCERMEQHPEGLFRVLTNLKNVYQPTGWLLLECHMLDSSAMGRLSIITYGPNNTLKDVPDRPLSPSGAAHDMSVVVAILRAEDLPSTYPRQDDLLQGPPGPS